MVTFWDSPLSTLKKTSKYFLAARASSSPALAARQWEQLGEMVGYKGDLAASGSGFCSSPKDLPHAFPLPADPSTAHPLASPSDALLIACHHRVPPGKGHGSFQSQGGAQHCGGRCSRRAASSPGRHHGVPPLNHRPSSLLLSTPEETQHL